MKEIENIVNKKTDKNHIMSAEDFKNLEISLQNQPTSKNFAR